MQCKQAVETGQKARAGSTEVASRTLLSDPARNAAGEFQAHLSFRLLGSCLELFCRVWTRTPADNNDLFWQIAAEPNPEISMVKMG